MKQPLLELRSNLRLVFDHLEAGDVPGSRLHARAYEGLAATLRMPESTWYPVMLRAMYALLEGRFADHERAMTEIAAWGRKDPSLELALLGHRMVVARLRAGHEGIRRERNGLLECAARNPPPYGTMIAAMLHARIGETEAARATLERTSPEEIVRHANVGIGQYGAEVAWRLADRSWAAPLYDWLRHHEGRMCVIGVAGFACDGSVDHALTLLAATLGRPEDAYRHHRRALARLRAMNARPLEALVRIDWVDILSQDRSIAAQLEAHAAPPPSTGEAHPVEMAREGEHWLVRGRGASCRMRATRGMEYLARLLQTPGREVHVLDLAAGGGVVDVGDAGEALDARARDAYRARAADLRSEIDQAEQWNDPGALERAREELSALDAELRRGLGLGVRARREKQASERARIAVKRRLDDAIRRIEEAEPPLGHHLREAVRTGVRCSYLPERVHPRTPRS